MERVAPLLLLVDDFDDARAMYAEYLVLSGYRVEQASDGRQAVTRALALRPDLLVMDLSLPLLDGWATLEELRGDRRTDRIPVIALTGYAKAGYARRARKAGFEAFLTKPCLPALLLAVVGDVLGRIRPGSGRAVAT
jgi:two-component system cell cycle response regulator DivK